MGAAESVLKSVEVGENFTQIPSLSKIWTNVAPAKYFQQQATVFIKEFDEDHDELKKFFECGIQTLKSLRHPHIVKYLDGSITSINACLIVERLRPLEYSLDDGFEKEEILSGLCDIFDAVLFLHEKAGLSHNNIGPVSVFISPEGTWKLGSFECVQRLENCLHWCQTEFAKHAKDDRFVPPEDQQMMHNNVPVHARDVYGLGKLVECLMPMLEEVLDDDQRDDVAQFVQRLTADEAAKRPPLIETNWKHVFRNDLYDIADFLRQLPLKSSEEKERFFRDLIDKLERLSPRVVARRLSKHLLSRFVLLEREAVENFLPKFLAFRDDDTGFLSAHLFKQYVIPELKKVFCVHETAIRLALLQYFDQYCQAFDEAALKDLILPELLLGMKDSDETIVSASMRSLADLVPLLGAEAVTGLKHTKYFCEGRPRIPSDARVSNSVDLSRLTSVKDAFSTSNTDTFPSRKPLQFPRTEPRADSKPLLFSKKESIPSTSSSTGPLKLKSFEDISPVSVTPMIESRSLISSPPPDDRSTSMLVDSDLTLPLVEEEEEFDEEHYADDDEDKPDVDWIDWDTDEKAAPNVDGGNDGVPVQFPTIDHSPAHSALIDHEQSSPSKREEPTREPSSSKQSKSLGAEFDVMAIEIAATQTTTMEDDLFADMAPKIVSTRTTVSKLIADVSETKPTVASTKFQASAEGDDGGGDAGWDDAQWGGDNDE